MSVKQRIVNQLLPVDCVPKHELGSDFAPTNIALVKYWGKRDEILRLPVTDSLSLTLTDYGANTTISVVDDDKDHIYLNDALLSLDHPFSQRLIKFLHLFRFANGYHYCVKTQSKVPIAAGVASSACGFAAVVKALVKLFGWDLSKKSQSILARLGSGSACRSFWDGFVLWQKGNQANGMDCHGCPLDYLWPDLCMGLLLISEQKKKISSSEAMRQTMDSPFYSLWPKKASEDMDNIHRAIMNQDFVKFGAICEANALTMHACMLTATPPIMYYQGQTVSCIQQIWQSRQQGLKLFFTQDAGPNLKLLFLQDDIKTVNKIFPDIFIIQPFLINSSQCL